MNNLAKITGVIFLFLLGIAGQPIRADVFQEDFEAGWGNWLVDRGIWGIGTPTVGPETCYRGVQCAGTILDGDYLPNTDSRLMSPSIRLSEVSGDEEIYLRFWHWFSYAGRDVGYVQISVYDETKEQWSSWETIIGDILGSSSIWTPIGVDLNKYAGQKIKIAFFHTAHEHYGESSGWYIDEVEITNVSSDLDAAREEGRQECIANPTSCGITPDPKDGSTQAGIDKCKANPTSCGITPDPKDGSTQAGIDKCKADPTSCGITPDPKDGSTQAGIDKCKADPTSCGITPDPKDGSTQAGIDKCQADPASCGIVNDASATYDPQLGEVHIPLIEVPGAFETIQRFEVYLMQHSNTFTFDLDMDRITLK